MKLNNTVFQIKITSGIIFGGIGYIVLRLLYLEMAILFLIVGFLLSCLITIGVVFSDPLSGKELTNLKNSIWELAVKYIHVYILAFSITAGGLFSLGG
ncbi:hypothetical protein NEF87_000109 [Candidatus Lokiarchaeum ossiferum]|uniref:DUF2178 domain-containing protein n=1 Tax=Candidatus Lokiarchaeum ossiferum TaxID=2951803 RepID=A0ABY6HJX1_9ARCH|nr:hypothetical protein NEF87_000109 [Candidatus Lokiarchaeum sp. B-35]